MEIKVEDFKKEYIEIADSMEQDFFQFVGLTEILYEAFSKDDDISDAIFGFSEYIYQRANLLRDTANVIKKLINVDHSLEEIKAETLMMFKDLLKDMELFLSVIKVFSFVSDEIGIKKSEKSKYYLNTIKALENRVDITIDSFETTTSILEHNI